MVTPFGPVQSFLTTLFFSFGRTETSRILPQVTFILTGSFVFGRPDTHVRGSIMSFYLFRVLSQGNVVAEFDGSDRSS